MFLKYSLEQPFELWWTHGRGHRQKTDGPVHMLPGTVGHVFGFASQRLEQQCPVLSQHSPRKCQLAVMQPDPTDHQVGIGNRVPFHFPSIHFKSSSQDTANGTFEKLVRQLLGSGERQVIGIPRIAQSRKLPPETPHQP